MNKEESVYLGDGLYADFDGYQIALKANDPRNPSDVVYLNESTLTNFLSYIETLKGNK